MSKNTSEIIPIVSSITGKAYDEINFIAIEAALKGVSSENFKQAMGNGL